MAILKRVGGLIVAAIVLGGCAIPMPLKVASWAIDGISYISTKKTVTDHGVSLAMGQDCALLRAVTEKGKVCVDDASSGTAVAKAEKPVDQGKKAAARPATEEDLVAVQADRPAPPATTPEADTPEADSDEDIATQLANFETAAGDDQAPTRAEIPARVETKLSPLPEDAGLLSLWLGESADATSIIASREVPQAGATGPDTEKAGQPAGLDRAPEIAVGAVRDAPVLPEGREIIARWEDIGMDRAGEEHLAENDEREELALAVENPQKESLRRDRRDQTSLEARDSLRSFARLDGRPGGSAAEIGGWPTLSGRLVTVGDGSDRENFRAREANEGDGLFAKRAPPPSGPAPPGSASHGETRAIFSPDWHSIRAGPRIGWDRVLLQRSDGPGPAPPLGEDRGRFAYLRAAIGPPMSYH